MESNRLQQQNHTQVKQGLWSCASLTSLERPILKQCCWIDQVEASKTTTFPSFKAHQSFGWALSSLSEGSRCPRNKAEKMREVKENKTLLETCGKAIIRQSRFVWNASSGIYIITYWLTQFSQRICPVIIHLLSSPHDLILYSRDTQSRDNLLHRWLRAELTGIAGRLLSPVNTANKSTPLVYSIKASHTMKKKKSTTESNTLHTIPCTVVQNNSSTGLYWKIKN